MSGPTLRDEAALQWNFLDDEHDSCIVVSERMELVYINATARGLVPSGWFGKRCFEVFPVADQTCAFHCPKIDAVNEASDTPSKVAYCEETLCKANLERIVLGVGLIPLGPARTDRTRAVFVLRRRDGSTSAPAFESQLLRDADEVRQRIATHLPAGP